LTIIDAAFLANDTREDAGNADGARRAFEAGVAVARCLRRDQHRDSVW
jgi:hypothetical protein